MYVFVYFQTTYEKFKANPPARIKRKAEKQRLEKEEAKRMREAEEQNNQSAIDPTTGQFIPPPLHPPNPPLNGGGDQKMVIFKKIYCSVMLIKKYIKL